MKNIVIVGASSAIAEASARIWAKQGNRLVLVGRNSENLAVMAADLKIRGAKLVEVYCADLNDLKLHEDILQFAIDSMGGIDLILIAHGTLPDQQLTQRSVELTMKELSTNALSTISLLTLVANVFESQKSGAIAVITSVAGDRGRQSNYIYGSAKAMVTTFLSGLRQRLTPQGIAVITIKPGFVDTPMTKEFKKGLLWAQPQQVAKSIVKACEKGSSVIYTPSFWALIMLIIKIIPERIFQKLKI